MKAAESTTKKPDENMPAFELSLHGLSSSLCAKSGCITLLRGDIASGKSLWLQRLAGLEDLPPDTSLSLSSKNTTLSPIIRMLFDRHPQLWLGQTVAEELCFGLSDMPSTETLDSVLQVWGIEELRTDADMQGLNRLQGIRLQLAGMELARTNLALIDNPTDGLPSSLASELIRDIQAWAVRSDCIVVVTCNRWHDWRLSASQIWLVQSPMLMPVLDSGEETRV